MREFFFGFYKPDTTRDLHQFCIFFWKYMLTISPLLIFNFIYYLVHLQVYNQIMYVQNFYFYTIFATRTMSIVETRPTNILLLTMRFLQFFKISKFFTFLANQTRCIVFGHLCSICGHHFLRDITLHIIIQNKNRVHYFIDLDKYYSSIKTKMWKNNSLKNLIAKMATNGASTLLLKNIFLWCILSMYYILKNVRKG